MRRKKRLRKSKSGKKAGRKASIEKPEKADFIVLQFVCKTINK
jgi:hypothetical protein